MMLQSLQIASLLTPLAAQRPGSLAGAQAMVKCNPSLGNDSFYSHSNSIGVFGFVVSPFQTDEIERLSLR